MNKFRPLPLLGNPHLQTIFANFLRLPVHVPSQTHFLTLPDGDQLALHDTRPKNWRQGMPTVAVAHGLGGDYRSSYMVRLARAFTALDWRTVRIDLRGAGAGRGRARRLYNAGSSGDLALVVEWLQRLEPASPLALVGMSLGGNIVMKLAGEVGPEAFPKLRAVAAISAPLDLARCSQLLEKLPRYDAFYVRHLRKLVALHEASWPAAERSTFPKTMTLRQFDDLYTAPRGGYVDAADYYRNVSSCHRIPNIGRPTLLLTARDDPFISCETYEELPDLPWINVNIEPQGGHLGFLGWDGNGGVRWGEQFLVSWLAEQFGMRDG